MYRIFTSTQGASIDKVLKFGGTSVGTAERIKQVIAIVQKANTLPLVVVVSALGGVTDQLILLGKQALLKRDHPDDYLESFEALKLQHLACAKDLGVTASAVKWIEAKFRELSEILEGVSNAGELSLKTLDLIMSFGEVLSGFIISEAIRLTTKKVQFVDARELIKTDRAFGEAHVDFEMTRHKIKEFFKDFSGLAILTGFIGSSVEGETTTLGRGGSDFTAAIVGAALHVNMIEIWTDVDGIMTADPKKEGYAFPQPRLSYKEAMEMSYFGAKVLHSPTILPVMHMKIPLLIKNSFHPEAPGTLITGTPSKGEALICGITSIDQVALISLQGRGILETCSITQRLFNVLAAHKIKVILVSQGSPDFAICFAIAPHHIAEATQGIEKEFLREIKLHLIDPLIIERHLSLIAAVGEKVRQTPGVAGKLFGALAKNGINVFACAQGASDLNITVVVKKSDETKAIRTIHEAFFLSRKKTLHLFVLGTGLIGSTLLNLIEKHSKNLSQEHALDLRVIGLANSQQMYFDSKGLPLKEWSALLQSADETRGVAYFVDHLIQLNLPNTIFVDCSASQSVTEAYAPLLNASVAVATPNKRALSGSYAHYQELTRLAAQKKIPFLYAATVGAGLPILSTLRELQRGGDRVLKIEATLSGTMSYLFNAFTGKIPFSELVREAQSKGFTEPDPREDLSGADCVRKLLIMARESGTPLELEDITIEPFLPPSCLEAGPAQDFYATLKKEDNRLEEMRAAAEKSRKKLRYLCTFANGKGSIALTSVEANHPYFGLDSNDTVVAITSEFYSNQPLVIRGPGAGAEVTAGKVLSQIVQSGLQ